MALAASAWAQVQPTGAGRALDANNLLGGGGWNSVRLAEPLFDSNRIVNGQITAGKSFRSDVGYRPADELRLNLPSRPMENFVRDSAGLPQVMSGVPTYEATPYLRPSSTILSPAAMAAGLGSPGTSMPPVTYTGIPPVQELVTQTLKSYQQGMATNVPMLPDMQLVSPDYAHTMPELPSNENYLRPPTSTLFGVMAKPDREKLSADLGGIIDLSQTARMDSQWDMNRDAAERGKGDRGKTDAERAAETARNKQPKDQPLDKNHLPAPGQDVFVDMMMLMQKNAANAVPMLPQEAEPARRTEPAPKPAEKKDEFEEQRQRDEAARRAAAAAKADRAQAAAATEAIDGQVVIHRLAGMGRDRYNTVLMLGQQALNQGEYYRAGGYFDNAVAASGGNPLGYLGGGLAMFGAQEPMSASLRIRAAMQVFPPLMQTMVDVEGLLGERVVTVRMGQLHTQMEQVKAEPALLFLDAFLRANTFDTMAAADQAAKLLEISDDPVHRAYAHVLLRRAGRETANQPPATPAALPPSLAPTTQP